MYVVTAVRPSWSDCRCVKRDLYTSKETNIHQKRPIHIKRDKQESKEKCISQKRPIGPVYIERD